MVYQKQQAIAFQEEQWINTLFLLSDTQGWIREQQTMLLSLVPLPGMKKFGRHQFHLTVTALAHILERHYFKILRHPNTGKFTISVVEILACIRDAAPETPVPIQGSPNEQRVVDTGRTIGFDQSAVPTSMLTVITDRGGKIITAFPGTLIH